MNQNTDILHEAKRLRLLAAALELQHYTSTAANVVEIPGGERVIAIGTPAAIIDQLKRSPDCDNSGDVHTPTGEWRGTCTCSAGTQQAAPSGYKLVPLEPTPEMQQAGFDTPGAHAYNASYRAMVAAAPIASAAQDDVAKDAAPKQAHGNRDDYFLMANARRLAATSTRAIMNTTNWSFAAQLFATGSNSAHQICVDAGIDPYGFRVERAASHAKNGGEHE